MGTTSALAEHKKDAADKMIRDAENPDKELEREERGWKKLLAGFKRKKR